jgi:hypothetical protein
MKGKQKKTSPKKELDAEEQLLKIAARIKDLRIKAGFSSYECKSRLN